MRREMFQTAAKANVNEAYCMTVEEMITLLTLVNTGDNTQQFDAIETAFKYGCELGQRALKREALR